MILNSYAVLDAFITLLRLLIGFMLAWLAASVLAGFVYGVSVRDPLTYALVPLLFATVGLAAGYLPARRATRVSPTEVMRQE